MIHEKGQKILKAFEDLQKILETKLAQLEDHAKTMADNHQTTIDCQRYLDAMQGPAIELAKKTFAKVG